MAGFHPHMPATRYTATAKLLGASMWFWVMYKAKEEGPIVLDRKGASTPSGIASGSAFRQDIAHGISGHKASLFQMPSPSLLHPEDTWGL
ncbi:hypothetical protein BGZ99_007717 [Dissophora globulifera]|uniref:Uncharacterized protein n=1 Tax=Dissophora globulifera TaxID=979702 RepID=A0A9P6UZI4_9FUNG|nr:hypothetical protein BGZ99_007717 [Dissophora globulifera]